MTDAAIREETFVSPTGASLHLYSAAPVGMPKAVAIICHGLSEHAGRYAPFMRTLAEAGIASLAPDHRGHGRTVTPDTAPHTFAKEDGAAKVLEDVAAVRAEAVKRHPGVPVIVFGHSMGGFIALNHAIERPADLAGLVIANSDLRGGPLLAVAKAVLAWERFRKGSDAEETIIKAITFDAWNSQVGDGRTEADWLSRDPAQVDAYIADPDCGWLPTVSMWRDLFRFVEAGADDDRLAELPTGLPVLLIGGGQDPATRKAKATRELYARMLERGMSDVTLRIDENDRHETLNEIGRDKAIGDFINWMVNVAGKYRP
ncbi:alpha/beta fold hydrolase [Notoacmeibacter sp. MSK16QG-6]|uniref:alpha/beta fold hydrolase n=1 Tax=Notoacmeibacter sp. MSK16QG-6 TaxID=2957982 RepID=UPI00209CCE02|nr:alpha/beta hydrolase [Notoacmeibacter sp. MSK16QG-6]MCP1199735.1 alpha/beta hydrolase [Notoacmeibacter sp. MSK16QG-6]